MFEVPTLLQGLGPLGSPPTLLLGLVALAVVILVGRVLLSVAWKIVALATVAVAALWVLATLGLEVGVF